MTGPRLIEVAAPFNEVWNGRLVRHRLQRLRERYAEHCDWTEESVYRACMDKRALLFMSPEDDSFAIVIIKDRPLPGGGTRKILFVWIACGENSKREPNIRLLKNIARAAGADTIEWESPRRGFDRMPGCKRGLTKYSMEV